MSGLTCSTDGSAFQRAGHHCLLLWQWFLSILGAALLFPSAVPGSPSIGAPWLQGTASRCCDCHTGAGKTRSEPSQAEPRARESFIRRALLGGQPGGEGCWQRYQPWAGGGCVATPIGDRHCSAGKRNTHFLQFRGISNRKSLLMEDLLRFNISEMQLVLALF